MKMNLSKKNVTKACLLCLLLTASFFLGRGSAAMVQECIGTFSVSGQVDNWGLGFGESGSETQPTGNVSAEELKKNNPYYIGGKEEKVIYLTFDCGYVKVKTRRHYSDRNV